jgi:hypothetical protein
MSDESRTASLTSEAEITLGLLNAVHENSAITQRSISNELGIALGLANAYLKRCATKGLIKMSQVPPNRYAYYLTPKGFAEKSRLTAEYLSQSFNLFRLARRQYADIFAHCEQRGWRDLALVGVGDVGEIASLSRDGHEVHLKGFIDPKSNLTEFAGLPVVPHPDALDRVDALVLTDLRDPQASFDAICRLFPSERVLFPKFLNVSRRAPVEPAQDGEETP